MLEHRTFFIRVEVVFAQGLICLDTVRNLFWKISLQLALELLLIFNLKKRFTLNSSELLQLSRFIRKFRLSLLQASSLLGVLAGVFTGVFGVVLSVSLPYSRTPHSTPSKIQKPAFGKTQSGMIESAQNFGRSPLADYSSTIISTRIQTFSNSGSIQNGSCDVADSCALTGAQFIEYKKLFRFKGEPIKLAAHFTDTRFVIKTKRISDLESFGVVQFIRGCMFRTRLVNGVPTKELSVSRNELGNTVLFQHKTWEIDNDNNDPLISAEPGYGRFALLRWNQDSKNVQSDGSILYGNTKPPHSTVFLSDLPTAGALMPTLDAADNTTLEFQTCIFKITDLPLKTDVKGSNVDKSKALFCAHWNHNYVFNFATQTTDEPKTADPICDLDPSVN